MSAGGVGLDAHSSQVNLRQNYIDIMHVAAEQLGKGVKPTTLMGIDVPRLKASATLFERIGHEDGDTELQPACARVMELLEEAS